MGMCLYVHCVYIVNGYIWIYIDIDIYTCVCVYIVNGYIQSDVLKCGI